MSGILIDNVALEILIIAAVVVLLSLIVRIFTTDMDKQDRIKEKSEKLQKEYNEALKSKDEKRIKEAEEKFKELNSLIKEMFKDSFKPLMYTFIPVIAIFALMKSTYDSLGTVITIPVLNWDLTWFWWYFIAIFLCSIVIEKIYKMIKKRVKK